MLKRSLLFLFVLCLMLPAAALAEKLTDLWVTGTVPAAADGAAREDDIHWWYSKTDKRYYLFLPACAPETMTLHFAGPETLMIGSETVQNGADFRAESGDQLIVANGKKEYKLTVLRSANVPALFIDTESGSLDYIHKKKGNEETGALLMMMPDGEVIYEGALSEIKGRGNATFAYAKKPYQIKLENKTDILGMGKHKTWILLANHYDNSLLRNRLSFDMAEASGLSYTPQSVPCDLFINGNYVGSYELCTKVQPDENRVDIPDLEDMTQELNDKDLEDYERFGRTRTNPGQVKGRKIPNDPEDITGGYLLEIELPMRYVYEASGYTTKRGQPIVVKYPEYASEKQMAYISGVLQRVENAIRAKDGIDPESGKHYTELIDMDSFVKKFMLEEVIKNFDGCNSSQYFYKKSDSVSELLYAGPAWDYDMSYGNHDRAAYLRTSGLCVGLNWEQKYFWWPALYRQADFRWAVQETYANVYLPILKTLLGQEKSVEGLRSIDEYAAEIEASAAMNYKRWPVFNARNRRVATGKNYQENVDYIKNFLTKRMAFLDEEWLIPYQNGQVAKQP